MAGEGFQSLIRRGKTLLQNFYLAWNKYLIAGSQGRDSKRLSDSTFSESPQRKAGSPVRARKKPKAEHH